MRFMRHRPPSATPASPILVDAKDKARCSPIIALEDGWWRADVSFEGEIRHIGKFGSETQAKRVADRWVEALLGKGEATPRKRGEAGMPGAPLVGPGFGR
jgi:hypothetical protein